MQSESTSYIQEIKGWFAATFVAVWLTGRSDLINIPFLKGFGWMAACLALSMLFYLLILKEPGTKRIIRMSITMAIILRVGLVFCYPNLSDDFYRYVWDGRLWMEGINPFDLTPAEWMAQLGHERAGEWQYLFDHLNSQNYHTVYPTVLQGVFAGAASLARGDIYLTMLLMKSCILLAEIGSIVLIYKIAKRLQLPANSVLIYALNPMVVVELVGNCHFEALMIFFFLAAFWVLMKAGIVPSAPLLALSIGSKLLPVLVFPFLVRRLGWGRGIVFGLLTLACCVPLFFYLAEGERMSHFMSSLKLYFQSFEFNGGIYYLTRSLLGDLGFWANRILPWLMLGLILVSAWRERNRVWTGLPAAMMLALTLYQLHSPVVHPWYITPLVAFAALGPYRYPILWSFLLPFTYLAYFFPDGVHEQMWLVWLEYLLLFGFMAYEWVFKRQHKTLTEFIVGVPFLRRMAQRSVPARLQIKLHRIAKHLQKSDKILDIGTGNGGLCRALRAEGFEVHPLDVADLSFFPEVKATLYDGETIPCADKSFDTCLLITMLHHTPQPEAVLREAIRVCRGKLVIMEDVYTNGFQKQLTFFTDSLVNLEFEGHPHTNKTDAQWQALFKNLDLRLVSREEFRTLLFFRQVIYVVEVGALSPMKGN